MGTMFHIRDQVFQGKSKLVKHISEKILNAYDTNTDLNEEDFRFMVEFLEYHESWESKIGCGIKRIWTQKSIHNLTCKEFCLERVDGSKEHFSFQTHKIKNTKRTPGGLRKPNLLDFKKACREAVSSDMIRFKKNHFKETGTTSDENDSPKVLCSLSNKLITADEAHVDHINPTFDEIVNEFVRHANLDLDNLPVDNHSTKQGGDTLNDANIKKQWIDFHREKSKNALRVIHKTENLKRPRKYTTQSR